MSNVVPFKVIDPPLILTVPLLVEPGENVIVWDRLLLKAA